MVNRIRRGVAPAALTLALAAAAGQSSAAAAGVTTLPPQSFSVRSGVEGAISFATMPSARCTVANPHGTAFVFYSDPDGTAYLHTRAPAAAANSSIRLNVQCAAGGNTAASSLTLRADARAAQTPAIKRSGPLVTLGPRGFNPATASDADLARYGYPPRPKTTLASGAGAAWLEAVRTTSITFTRSVAHPDLFMGPAQRTARVGATIANGSATSNTWSGFANFGDAANAGSPFSDVVGEWFVPGVVPDIFKASYSALWAGLDGWTDKDVVQAGTFQNVSSCFTGCWQLTSYKAWYEFFPDTSQEMFSVNPGDRIYTESWITFNAAGIPVGNFYVKDITAQVGGQDAETMPTYDPTYPQFDGSSAEWIMERPTVTYWFFGWHSYVPRLSDFSQAWFSFALAEHANGSVVDYGSGSNLQITMTNSNGQALSTVAPLDFESMLFTWKAAQ